MRADLLLPTLPFAADLGGPTLEARAMVRNRIAVVQTIAGRRFAGPCRIGAAPAPPFLDGECAAWRNRRRTPELSLAPIDAVVAPPRSSHGDELPGRRSWWRHGDIARKLGTRRLVEPAFSGIRSLDTGATTGRLVPASRAIATPRAPIAPRCPSRYRSPGDELRFISGPTSSEVEGTPEAGRR